MIITSKLEFPKMIPEGNYKATVIELIPKGDLFQLTFEILDQKTNKKIGTLIEYVLRKKVNDYIKEEYFDVTVETIILPEKGMERRGLVKK